MTDAADSSRFDGATVCVTGATGLLGRALVARLLAAGARVRTASTRPDPPGFPLADVDHRAGDLRDSHFTAALFDGQVDGLFHLAGVRGSIGIQRSQGARLLADNTLIDFNTLEAARRAGVDWVCYTSSVTVYPPSAGVESYREDLAWTGLPHHGAEFVSWSMRLTEKLIEAWGVQYERPRAAVLRLVNTFGPHDDFDPATALVVPALIGRVLGGEDPLVVWGDGTAVRDFLYVDDAVDGLLLGATAGLGQGPINIGSGQGHSIREVVEAILAATGRAPEVRWDDSKPAGEARKVVDTTRATALLGFAPRVAFADAIARTVEWYRAQGV